MTRDPESVSCVEAGRTTWNFTDPCRHEIEKLDDEGGDDAVLGFFDALIEMSGTTALTALLGWKSAADMRTESRAASQGSRRSGSRAHHKQTKQIEQSRQIVARWAREMSVGYRKLRR